MNIWIFNHYAIAPGSSGGTRHYDLARKLVEQGHSVTIFASSFNHQTLKEEHLSKSNDKCSKKVYNGVNYVWLKTVSYESNSWRRVMNILSYTISAYKYAKGMKENPDVVIGSSVHPLAAYVGYKISKIKKAVFYFEERDLWPQTLVDLGKLSNRSPIIFLLAKIESFLYRKSSRIILLFENAINYVESKGINREKVIFLPNGIDTDRFNNITKLPDYLENEFKKVDGKLIAIYTGTHGLANNLDVIIDAAKLLQKQNSPVHFFMIGNGPNKSDLINRSLVEKINNITFIESQPKEIIPSLLKKADIGLLPLKDSPVFKWGISPNKMYDYMGSSLPVLLLCNLDGTPMERNNAGKVIKQNFVEEIVNYLGHIKKEELESMGKNAFKYVNEQHDWSKLSKRLEESMLIDTGDEKA